MSVRAATAAVVTLLVTAACVSSCASVASAGHSGSAASTSSAAVGPILRAFRSMCASNGVPAPTDIEYVRSTVSPAERLLYGSARSSAPPGGTRVLVLAARGSFVGYMANVPSGAARPTGGVLTEVAVLAGGDVVDWGITNSYPALHALGPVVTVH